MNNIDEKILKNINQLIVNHELYFDEGIARYLLNRLGVDKIKKEKMYFVNNNVCTINANIYGLIYYLRNNAEHLKRSDYPEHVVKYENAIKQNEIWCKLIKEMSPDLLKYPEYEIQLLDKDKRLNVSFGLLMALNNFSDWIKNFNKNDNYKLVDDEEEKIFIRSYYTNYQMDKASYLIDSNHDVVEYLTSLTIKHFDYMRKAESKTASSMLNKLLDLNNFQCLMKLKSNDLSVLFINHLDVLIRFCNARENSIKKPKMLSDVLSNIDKEIWKAYFSKDDKINVISLCSKPLTLMSGYSLEKINNMIKSKKSLATSNKKINSKELSNEVINRLMLLKDELDTIPKVDIDKLFLFASKIENPLMIKGLVDLLGLPPRDENNVFLYKMLDSATFNENGNKIKIIFKEIEAQYYKDKMEKELPKKEIKQAVLKI